MPSIVSETLPSAGAIGASSARRISRYTGYSSLRQPIVDMRLKPTDVAWFKSNVRLGSQTQVAEKTIGHLRIEFEFRRELHQHSAEFATEPADLVDEAIKQAVAIG